MNVMNTLNQSPKNWKIFVCPEFFGAYLQNSVPHCLESFCSVWKVSGQSGKFPDSLESFRTVWNFFGQSGRFLTNLKSFWTAWKVSGQFVRFTTNLQMPEVCYDMDEINKVGHQQS